MNNETCTDCRDAGLTTDQEKATRICSSCYADMLEAERGQ